MSTADTPAFGFKPWGTKACHRLLLGRQFDALRSPLPSPQLSPSRDRRGGDQLQLAALLSLTLLLVPWC